MRMDGVVVLLFLLLFNINARNLTRRHIADDIDGRFATKECQSNYGVCKNVVKPELTFMSVSATFVLFR